MYAVVSSGGKQYRVEAGTELIVERLSEDAGSTITFDRVLLVGDGEAVTVGTPTVEGATVSGTVLGEALGPKLVVFKFKQKVKYRRKNGHRQHLTRVRIDEISAGGEQSKAPAKAKADAAASATGAKPERKTSRQSTAKAAGESAGTGSGDEKPKATRRRSTAKQAGTETKAEE